MTREEMIHAVRKVKALDGMEYEINSLIVALVREAPGIGDLIHMPPGARELSAEAIVDEAMRRTRQQ